MLRFAAEVLVAAVVRRRRMRSFVLGYAGALLAAAVRGGGE